MTKKHFIAIARILKNQRLSIQGIEDNQFENLISNIENQLINVFVDDNPRFDISRFRQATQLTEEERKLAI
jgi:hypothetical protein